MPSSHLSQKPSRTRQHALLSAKQFPWERTSQRLLSASQSKHTMLCRTRARSRTAASTQPACGQHVHQNRLHNWACSSCALQRAWGGLQDAVGNGLYKLHCFHQARER